MAGHARRARPTHAILNDASALLARQTRPALASRGFDRACGFLHAEKSGRDSLVYDLMECERGTVESLVLDVLQATTFHRGDVTPVTDGSCGSCGSCRLHPQLARAVVAACRVPQARVDEHARWLQVPLLRALEADDEAAADGGAGAGAARHRGAHTRTARHTHTARR